ncbi:hypothetical protein Acor_52340 [Acrocarpospora corrugata]|uniref:Lantibiotic dehydratase N-terminal domain-containing protein n=1 Tax=Acrocarpospora corrugata TaxID=35763 RepID=A0A5M3W9J0_9ACTN|nr:lantibiotic dehydratase [Acrocarpospora corrugata]GES03168.1 hypothetical protein Acor_52340 [Acrocarpospora corrugata]
MSNDAWRPWADVAVRSAGFPIHELLRLADPETAALALDPESSAERIHESWHRGIHRTSAHLLSMAEGDSFQAALLWQNPHAVEHVTGWLRRHAADTTRTRDRRRKEAKLTRYAQRYHARNETIGFFGPCTWTDFSDDVEVITAQPGPNLVAAREVHFEDWAIDALGTALAKDPAIRRRLAPARLAGVVVQGPLALYPDGSPCRLPSVDAAVLAAVDGTRTPRSLTAELRWQGFTGVTREDDVVAALERLLARGLIVWRPDVPVDPWPERALRRQLQALPESDGRAAALDALAQLEDARAAVADAADQPAGLAKAFTLLDQRMKQLTEAPAVRTKDQGHYGRRAVYEDCRRDVDVRLGAGLRSSLLPPLSLMLDSARWLTWRFGDHLESLIGELYDQFAGMTPGNGVPLGIIVNQFLDRISDPAWSAPLVEEFQKSWSDILSWRAGERRVRRDSAGLAVPVAAAFAAPPPLWYGAAQHSPDVMIAAAGLGELQAGRYEFVLGEIHLAMATLDNYAFTTAHPDPDRLRHAAEAGPADRPRVVPIYPRSPKVTGRNYPTPDLFSDRYWYLSFAPGNGARAVPRGRSLPLDELVAERTGTSITVRTRSGARMRVLDVVGELTQEVLVNLFQPLPPLPHTPRVTIDDLVVAREKWRLPAHTIPAGSGRDEPAAFAALRRWAETTGLPRFVFWRAAGRTKPVYLDFDSPLFVNDFLASVRQARGDGVVELTEMHPDPHHVWLPDADGHRYTCELRLVLADQSG